MNEQDRKDEQEFRNKQVHISTLASANQKYHQIRWYRFSWADRIFKIIVGILAVVGLCFCVVTFFRPPGNGYDIASISIAGAAAFFAILLNVIPFGEWSSDHVELFRRWTDLREDIDDLLFDLKSPISGDLQTRLRHLEAKVHRICGSESCGKEKLFQKCWEEAKLARNTLVVVGSPANPTPTPAPQ